MRTESRYASLLCLLALAACTDATSSLRVEGTGGGIEGSPPPEFKLAYTERIGQLTGTTQNPLAMDRVGFVGTDLGISYERDGELIFLFGDSWTDPSTWLTQGVGDLNLDSVARTSAARPDGTPKLEWFTRQASRAFQPFVVPKVEPGNEPHEMREMSVPVEGIANGPVDYLFFHVTPFMKDEMGERILDDDGHPIALPAISVVAEASVEDGFRKMTTLHEEVNTNFKSVSTVRFQDDVYVYGARDYRASAIYLAKAPFSTLGDRSTWTYYAGAHGVEFVPTESEGAALIAENCVGELSVRKHPAEELYFMTYNCGTDGNNTYPHEIRLRTARHPEGPWSEPTVIFQQNEGNGHFVHSPSPETEFIQGPHDDGLQAPYFNYEPGDVYGPYLVPQWFRDPAPGVHEIVYTLSSWNPYQVHLMRTVLTDLGVTVERPTPQDKEQPRELQNADFANGIAGWTEGEGVDEESPVFHTGANGWAVTTQLPGDAPNPGVHTGRLSQHFDVGAKSTLRFDVIGQSGAVMLIHDGQIVRQTRVYNASQALPVQWNLSSLRGKSVELVIADEGTSQLDYIAVTPFQFSE